MKTFTLLATLFVAVALTEAWSSVPNKRQIVGYLSVYTGATEKELNAKPLSKLIAMAIQVTENRLAEEKDDPEQAQMIGDILSYFQGLKADPEDNVTEAPVDVTEVQHIESEEDFDAQVERAGSKLVVVDFFATWCGPCKGIAPQLDTFAKQYSSQIVILKVDVEQLDDLANVRYQVTSMPTFVFLKHGIKVERFSGADAARIEATIKKFSV